MATDGTKTSQLIVDSRDRNSGSTSSTNFTVNLKETLSDTCRVELDFPLIPATYYTVNSTNNLIVFNDGSTNQTATISSGNYSANALASAIQTAMQTLITAESDGNTVTVSYSSTTFAFTFAITPGTLSLKFSQANTMWQLLGFTNADTSSVASVTGSNVVSMERPDLLVISIQELDIQIYKGSTSINGTFVIRFDSPAATVNVWEPQKVVAVQYYEPKTLNKLTINLTDITGTNVSLNGADWIFIMRIFRKNPWEACGCCGENRVGKMSGAKDGNYRNPFY